MTKITELRRQSVGAVLDGLEADGVPGLVKAVFRMIGENQPSIDCLTQADNDFNSAANPEPLEEEGAPTSFQEDQVWGAALDMAGCLRDAILEPDVPEPPPPPPEDPHPDPIPPGGTHSLADVVLAALLVHVQKQGRSRSEVRQQRKEPQPA